MSRKQFDSLSYSLVDLFEKDDNSDAEIFHESTKITRKNYASLSRRTEFIQRNPELVLTMTRSYKTYAGSARVPLPPASLGEARLEDVILRRRSQVGAFTGQSAGLDQLSAILKFSYGITRSFESRTFPGKMVHFRAAPSGGGLYPLEIYPLVLNVEGCPPGVYHYSVVDHALEVVRQGDLLTEIAGMTTYYDRCSTAAVLFAITGVFQRTIAKYQFRGYRFLSYDVGIVLQNLYLASTSLGLGSCAIGGFYDDEVGKLLRIDNVDENALMMFAVGHAGDGARERSLGG
jgi:SagB-type dehydrogenase family enzyme